MEKDVFVEVRFASRAYRDLREHLLDGGEDEEAAVLLAGISQTPETVRLLVRELLPVPDSAFRKKGPAYLCIDPDFLAPLVKRCRQEGLAFLLSHSHPFATDTVGFSGIDDAGERELFPRILARVPAQPVGALVFGQRAVAARVWLPARNGPSPVDRVISVGAQIDVMLDRKTGGSEAERERYSRQMLAFGRSGQECLASTRVAVVGAGGTGSQVFQQLTHLGAGHVDLVDPQLLEESNLSRVVGSTPSDVGRPKVVVLSEWRSRARPTSRGDAIVGDVRDRQVAMRLRDADVIFSCTDSLQSRLVLNRVSRQYMIPLIDLGIDIQLVDGMTGRVRAIGGRVMTVQPDGPCLACLGVLDPRRLQQESSPDWHASYVSGRAILDPSVISLNGVVASLAVTEFLNMITGFAGEKEPTYQRYDGIRGVVRTYPLCREEPCTCSELHGLGDLEPLPDLVSH